MGENKKRSFIIDYGCCLPFGHNLQCVKLYMKKEEDRGQIASAIVCKRVKSFKGNDQEGFYYSLPTLYRVLVIDTINYRLVRFYLKQIKKIYSLPFGKVNLLKLQAKSSIDKIFKKHNFGKDDQLVFPSAEYYGVNAFLKKISKIKIEDRPKVHIRFIGVLENSHSYYRDSVSELVGLINENYQTLTISAEVPVYARYLNTLITNIEVKPEPYPLEKNDISVKKEKLDNNKFTIVLPGTNRTDKGYFETFNLAKEVLFEFPSVKFVVQDMKKWNKDFNKKYQKKLSKLANVELVDAILPKNQIEALYEQADLILLPYDPDVYHLRGSAIHYEAIQSRIPILVRKGVGFIEEVEQWSSGWVYETKQELFTCLKEIIETDAKSMEEKMNNSLIKFKKNSDEAYRFNLS